MASAPPQRTVRAGFRSQARLLPYLLSLPALLVCIGILIPFFTAVYYSLLRFRLNLPLMKGFIWFDNYINFLTDAAFWNTVADLARSMPASPSASSCCSASASRCCCRSRRASTTSSRSCCCCR